jgi:predicted ester cyclase
MTLTESEDNKALVRRWLDFGQAGFAGDFTDYIARDYVGYLSGRQTMDFAELVRLERQFAAAFSRTHYSVEDLIAEGDKVVLRVTTDAIHSAEFLGIAATGKPVSFTGIVIYRLHNGQITQSWGEIDFAGLWRQLTS